MKPMGPIPSEFAVQSDNLIIAGKTAAEWIEIAGDTPLFVYDTDIVANRVKRLRAALPIAVAIHYAVKANPALIAAVAPLVDGLDIASAGELAMVQAAAPDTPVSFAGPGKRDDELSAAIKAGVTINLESAGEAARALAIGERLCIRPHLAVRVNPDLELRGSGMKMGGRASPFGVEVEAVPDVVRSIIDGGAEWRGFHIFAGSQALETQALIDAQAATLALAARLAEAIGHVPPLVNIGGGFGVPYFPGDRPVDVEAIGAAIADAMTSLPPSLTGARFAIELGRWLVAESGVYLTRIVDRKTSRGETFLIVDGGLHHQLAASGNFGTVVRRNYPIALVHRMGEAPTGTVTVVGCLCTPLDRLGDQIALPEAAIGDVIAIFMAGAYGRSASPTAFLGHPAPREIVAGSSDNPNAIFTS
ncbi:MAG: pyridoxal-dependent decarboxylase, exosortase A system-associated [Sphingomonas sp.]|uniref:pyridoxal-dependent decarboxylase, exosortase A system-associated n=1 Tax=Sphingomonas sp. TaxID=28214 RepID=UPI0025DC112A|nr:pyridoxal-dependent decarboxylase, exosortase A system-associated [Sphingomonas sp.]MBY0283012.1 pyridoxal-dependent decarboxylase, exosortase A system-associated [Sphingomonas sp.]